MKKLIVIFLSIVSMNSCQDSVTTPTMKRHDSPLHKAVGAKISSEDAVRWISAYQSRLEQGRVQETSHVVTASTFDSILSSPDLLGVAFHYAVDDVGNHHVLLLPMDETTHLWSLTNDRVCIDANIDTILDEVTAKRWVLNFTNKFPDHIRYHFFGSDILFEMRRLSAFEQFSITPAIDDELQLQLLLIVGKIDLAAGGRTMDNGDVFDRSVNCPPTCGIQ
jgi:hypothetical protein